MSTQYILPSHLSTTEFSTQPNKALMFKITNDKPLVDLVKLHYCNASFIDFNKYLMMFWHKDLFFAKVKYNKVNSITPINTHVQTIDLKLFY